MGASPARVGALASAGALGLYLWVVHAEGWVSVVAAFIGAVTFLAVIRLSCAIRAPREQVREILDENIAANFQTKHGAVRLFMDGGVSASASTGNRVERISAPAVTITNHSTLIGARIVFQARKSGTAIPMLSYHDNHESKTMSRMSVPLDPGDDAQVALQFPVEGLGVSHDDAPKFEIWAYDRLRPRAGWRHLKPNEELELPAPLSKPSD